MNSAALLLPVAHAASSDPCRPETAWLPEDWRRRLAWLRAALPACILFWPSLARAELLTAALAVPAAAEAGYFKMGAPRSPAGEEITVDARSLRLDGRAWMPAMGEIHYTRYPADEWREELLKMKAGGIDIVATYVFWIHHEEIAGQWDWSGRRDLRRFVETAGDVGLKVIVRCGPWCHGEVRNGGFPEWAAQRKDWKPRSTDPKFLDVVRPLYGQIARQLRGLLWKDGGPVIGIQVDNEYRGPAEYLLALKSIAREAGLDVPLYTRTGWPALTTPMPLGEILPLYGAYAEGFWDREMAPMPGRYWAGFHFSTLRSDVNIANELLGRRDAKDDDDAQKYPYLTCEIGGGMMSSYHRRILIDPRDVEATTLVKIGSGSTGPGYYMYHGGTNPDGALTTLMEAQDTVMTNYNDMPVKNYDFQAPLGQFGQIRPHYHSLRRLHLFLRDFGARLAPMTTTLPAQRPAGKDDTATVRWAVRSDGQSGFVFFNHYERLRVLPPREQVLFSLTLANRETLTFKQPVTLPSGAIGFWPFNFELGNGMRIEWATAQPLCFLEHEGVRTFFFAAEPGVPPTFEFGREPKGEISMADGTMALGGSGNWRAGPYTPTPGRDVALRLKGKTGREARIVVLSREDSLALWKGRWRGRDCVVLTRAGVVFDGEQLRVTASGPQSLGVFPPIDAVARYGGGGKMTMSSDGVFASTVLPIVESESTPVAFERVRDAGPAREIKNGPIMQAVPQMPSDADFAAAAEWRVTLPPGVALDRNPLLRFHYAGDVARIRIGNRLATDDYYNGLPVDLGLRPFAPESMRDEIRIAILPLRADAPIYLANQARPNFEGKPSHVSLRNVELVQTTTVALTRD